jgi:hypothetical protein
MDPKRADAQNIRFFEGSTGSHRFYRKENKVFKNLNLLYFRRGFTLSLMYE